MNFDINMLSTLMQMLGAQKNKNENTSHEEAADTGERTANKNASVFAAQNGLGQRVSFGDSEPKPKRSNAQANPLSSMLEMMTGNTSSGGGDMMSSLMPMLLNMMSGNKTAAAQSAPKQENKKSDTNGDMAEKTASPPKGNMKTQPHSQDKYEPIAFAGYALISTLNKLYTSVR